MWLIDKNLPIQLFLLLEEFGIKAVTAEYQGWGGFTDSALVAAAIESGVVCILTRDRHFSQSAAKVFNHQPELAIVIVEIPQMHRRQFLHEFREAWSRQAISPVPGMVITWPGQGHE